ncbi:MAG: carbohydrate ABC transporter permease [Caldilineaceae bacterium]|nr:carbohydrate ABC transporter permease [Caldilineaceae bacterium]MBP8291245.1 carbohydrate ABC transporter permease [Caldilineaceae bacterium]
MAQGPVFRPSRSYRIFQALNSIFMLALLLTMLVPFVNTLALSFSTPRNSMQPGIVLWPDPFSLSGYEVLFKQIDIWRPLLNNTYVAVVGTLLHVMLSAITAYALVRRPFPGRRIFVFLLLVTMMIPMENIMIPIYVVYKDLGLLNTLNAIVVSGAVSGFSVLLLKNFFEGIPVELAESAEIDGATDLRVFAQIFLPLSLAGLATVTLFQFVSKWNNFFEAVLFLSDTSKYTLQIALKSLIINSDITSTTDAVVKNTQMAGVVVSVLPLIILYPFLQRFFTSGITLGAVKE